MRILVTGVNGFMGTNFAAYAANEHDVFGIYLPGTPTKQCEAFVQGLLPVDIRERDAVIRAFKEIRPDAILHLAAKVGDTGDAKAYLDVNVMGLENCLDAALASGAKRFVSMSSLAIHGPGPFRNADENTPAMADYPNYAVSKVMGEALIKEYTTAGLETVIIRPGLIPFGRFDRLFSLELVKTIRRGLVPLVNGGRAIINTAYAENLVQGLLLAVTHENAANETFIIADPPLSFKTLADLFARLIGKKAVKVSIPSGPLVVAGKLIERLPLPFPLPITEYRARVVATDFWFSTEKAEKLLGYKPNIAVDEAVARTVAWALEETSGF